MLTTQTGPRTQPGERGTKSFDEEAIAKILCGRLDMNTSTRITLGARFDWRNFLAEASVFAIVIPVFMIWGQHALLYAAPSASLVMCFLFALWWGRLESGFVSHGMLVGVAATFLYVGLTLARPSPFAYLVAHGLKNIGRCRRWCLRDGDARRRPPQIGPRIEPALKRDRSFSRIDGKDRTWPSVRG